MKQVTFQSVFETPTARQGNLMSEAQTPDGNIWTYLYATEAITKHMIASQPAVTGVDTVSSSQNSRSENVYITEASAGWTVGAYQDHWVLVDSGTGSGQVAKIKDNSADTLELYEDYALSTALAVADSDITIVHTPDAEKVPVTNVYQPCVAVAQATFASGNYGYFLKKGIGGVLLGEAGTVNRAITPGDNTAGHGMTVDDGDDLYDATIIGYCIAAQDTADEACLAKINVM